MDLGYKLEKGLYLISPEKIEDLKSFVNDLKFIFKRTKVEIFQLRLKDADEDFIIQAINLIKPVCIKFNVLFILNDNPKLAARYACDGVHVGKFDGEFNDILKQFQGIIGVSCYGDIKRAINLANSGASYVSFGACFKSKTKPEAPICKLEIFDQFKQKSNLPMCAIGGIDSSNAKSVIEKGASLIAISSAIWSLNSNEKRVEEIQKINNLIKS